MDDLAHVYTDKQIQKLQHELDIVYKQAEIDIRHKMDDFNKKYRVKERIHLKELRDGKITQDQYDNWVKGQVFQGQQWQAKRDSILDTMHHTNEIATRMINGQTQNVFMVNANYESYSMEHGMGVNFGFGIYDSATVTGLIKDNPKLLPEWKIDEKKDYIWSQKKLNRSVTQGIIQGESLDKIADRLSNKLVSQNKNKMKTFARTAMTGAQNAGRLTSMRNAKNLGIDLQKEWMATLDSHTRDSHADVDGERVDVNSKFSNGLMYPGEPGGMPAEVYNCRCTMVSDIKKYPDKYKRYDNIEGKPIDNMTYKEWAKAKGVERKKTGINYAKYGSKEIFDIMAKYGDYQTFLDDATEAEFDLVWTHYGTTGKIKSAYKAGAEDIKSTRATKTKTAQKAQKTVQKAPVPAIEATPRNKDYINNVTEIAFKNYPSAKTDVQKTYSALANKLGLTEAEVKEGLDKGLTKILDASDFTMHINSYNLEKVLDGGYFKNQFETGSSGGALNPDKRRRLENKMFNVPKDNTNGMSDSDRPVYGMFCPKYPSGKAKADMSDVEKRTAIYYNNGPGSWYGNGVTVVLKKEKVVNNATMTLGDSLDYEGALVGMEVSKPSFGGSYIADRYDKSKYEDKKLVELVNFGRNDKSTDEDAHKALMDFTFGGSDQYFEYQLHGKDSHSADNIEKVILDGRQHDHGKYDTLVKKLEEKGIPYEINR